MQKISTGEDSTLGTYKKIATIFGDGPKKFIQDKIDESPNGENEEVLADERQMLMLLASKMDESEKRMGYIEWKIKDALKPTHAGECMHGRILKSEKIYQRTTHGR